MAGNKILNKEKHTHNTDEWYTDYKTVYEEVSQYINHFAGKIVLCNCDDPYESAFTKYFLKHFNILKLRKLICTSYKGSRINRRDILEFRPGHKIEVLKWDAKKQDIDRMNSIT